MHVKWIDGSWEKYIIKIKQKFISLVPNERDLCAEKTIQYIGKNLKPN